MRDIILIGYTTLEPTLRAHFYLQDIQIVNNKLLLVLGSVKPPAKLKDPLAGVSATIAGGYTSTSLSTFGSGFGAVFG